MNKRLILLFILSMLLVFKLVSFQNKENESTRINQENFDKNENIKVNYSSNINAQGASINESHDLEVIASKEKKENPILLYYSLSSYDQVPEMIDGFLSSGYTKEAQMLTDISNTRCYNVGSEDYFVYHGKESEGYKLIKDFCNDFTIDFDVEEYKNSTNNIFKNADELQEKILSNLSDGFENGDVESALLESIYNANDPFELEAIKVGNGVFMALAEGYNYIFDQKTNVLLDIDGQAISNAINIYSCNKFRYCDRGGVEYIGYCLVLGDICKNYTNTVDILYATLSPIETQKMEVVLSAIYNYDS